MNGQAMRVRSLRIPAASLGTLIVLATITGCQQRAAVQSSDDAQWQRQAEQIQHQIDRTDQQLERLDRVYDKSEEQARRMDQLLDRWEGQAARYDQILDRWERQPPPAAK